MNDDILGSVAHHDNEAALLFLDSIADERGDARVSAIALSKFHSRWMHILTLLYAPSLHAAMLLSRPIRLLGKIK